MQYKNCAVADDVVEMLNLRHSVVAKHTLGCWETAKATRTIKADIVLTV